MAGMNSPLVLSMLVIVRSQPPALWMNSLFVAMSLRHTSPKSPSKVVTRVDSSPLPLASTSTSGRAGSLLGIVRIALTGPAAVGVNVTSNSKQKSGLITTG